MKVRGCRPAFCSCDKHICSPKGHWRTNKKPLQMIWRHLNQRHTFLVSKVWVSLWEGWSLDSKHWTNSSHHVDLQICYFKGNSYSVVAIVHLSLKVRGNSSQLPFIWFSLICGREWELEESQVSTTRSDNGVCWSGQVRKKLCENVVTFCSFISNLKQGQEDRISLFLTRRIGLELYVMVDANEAESVQKRCY